MVRTPFAGGRDARMYWTEYELDSDLDPIVSRGDGEAAAGAPGGASAGGVTWPGHRRGNARDQSERRRVRRRRWSRLTGVLFGVSRRGHVLRLACCVAVVAGVAGLLGWLVPQSGRSGGHTAPPAGGAPLSRVVSVRTTLAFAPPIRPHATEATTTGRAVEDPTGAISLPTRLVPGQRNEDLFP